MNIWKFLKLTLVQLVFWYIGTFALAEEPKLTSNEEGKIQVLSFNPFKADYVDSYNESESWAKLEIVEDLDLPQNFTICSAISRNNTDVGLFFTLLGQNLSSPYLSALVYGPDPENQMSNFCFLSSQNTWNCKQELALIYPYELVHSCMAVSINSTSLQIQWVVKGTVAENVILQTDGNRPKTLSDRMILGMSSQKVLII